MKTLIIIALLLSIFSCNLKQSSRLRFSEKCDIKIPKDVIVTKDEYQNMLQDYVINYEIALTDSAMNQIVNSIKNSKYYNSRINTASNVSTDTSTKIKDKKANWVQSKSGYLLSYQHDNISCYAFIDTIQMTGKFKLSSD